MAWRNGWAISPLLLLAFGLAIPAAQAATTVGTVPGKFSVSPAGAANYQVPLDLPPGVNGLKPTLAVLYNSQAGNGFLGQGWSLTGLSVISRCPQTLAQDGAIHSPDLTSADRYCLDGERLVVTHGSYGAASSVYHTEIESFQKVTASSTLAGNAPASFTVVDRAGITRIYGGPCIVGGDSSTCFSWPVSRITDRYGNFISFTYDIGFAAYGNYQGAYGISEIQYGNTQGVVVGDLKFTYANGQSGAIRADATGPVFARTGLLTNPVMLTGVGIYNGGGQLLRSYTLNYAVAGSGPSMVPTLLNSVTECSPTNTCYSPTTFTYSGSAPGFVQSGGSGGDLIGDASDATALHIADLDGDGLPDYVYNSANGIQVFFGANMANTIAVPAPVASASQAGIDLQGAIAADLNGDGKQELLVAYFPHPGVSPDPPVWRMLQWNGRNDSGKNLMFTTVPTSDGQDPQVCSATTQSCQVDALAISANGNGQTGILYANAGQIYYYPNANGVLNDTPTGTGLSYQLVNGAPPALRPVSYSGEGQAEVYVAGQGILQWNPGVGRFQVEITGGYDDANTQVIFLDTGADGLSDVVVIQGTGWYGFMNSGFGFTLDSNLLSNVNYATAPSGTDATHAQVIDWFGDGRQEIIVPVNGVWYLFQPNSQGGTFTRTGSTVQGTPTGIVDVNGDGRLDVLFNYNGHAEFLPSSARPYVLNEITNGLGQRTDIGYIPLTQAGHSAYVPGIASPQLNAPEIRAFVAPMYVVDDFAVDTGLFNSSGAEQIYTYYKYGGGALDQWGRGFLGFSQVEAINYNSGLLTEVTYRQDFPFAGMVSASTTSYSPQALTPASVGAGGAQVTCDVSSGEPDCTVGNPALQTTNDFLSGNPLGTTTNQYKDDVPTFAQVYAPYLSQTQTQAFDPGALQPYETTTTVSTYTAVNTNTSIGVDVMPTEVKVTTTDANDATDKATVDTTSVYGDESACPGHATSVTVSRTFQGTTAPSQSESFSYDGHCFLTGDSKTIVDSTGAPTLTLTKTYAPDGYGNPLSSSVSGTNVPQAPRTTTMVYDPAGRFPQTISNPLGQSATLGYDDWGATLTATDANGNTVTYQYDGLGRKKQQSGPEPGVNTTWSYAACTSTCAATTVYQVTQAGSDGSTVTTQFDELGRAVRSTHAGFGGETVLSDTQYDLLGRLSATSAAHKSGATVCWNVKNYDILNRLTVEYQPIAAAQCAASAGASSGSPERTLTTAYSGLQTTHTVADPSGDTPVTSENSTTHFNVLAKPASVTDVGGTISYRYDPWGNLTSVTPPGGATVAMSYDSAGNKLSMQDPDMGAWSYSYDALGELLSQTDAKGQTVSNGYDALGRLVSRIEPEGTTIWKYDIAFGAGVGKLAYTLGPNGVWEGYAYDAYGSPTDKITVVNGQEYWVTTTYDDQERPSQLLYPNLTAVNVNGTPATPSGLAAAVDAANNAALDLNWTAVQQGEIYHLYRTLSTAAGPQDGDEIYSGPEADWQDLTISADGTYTWWLKACNAANCGGFATTTLAVTLPPTLPGNLQVAPATDDHTGNWSVSWSGSALPPGGSGTINYLLDEIQPGGATPQVYSGNATQTGTLAHTVNGSYSYKLRGCLTDPVTHATGCTTWVTGGNNTVLLTPPTPSSITLPQNSSWDGSFTLTWKEPSTTTVTGYTVQLGQMVSGTQFIAWTSGGCQTTASVKSCTFTTLANGTYYARVKACDTASICSAWLQAANAVGVLAITPPATPTNTTVSTSTTSSPYLITWTDTATVTRPISYYVLFQSCKLLCGSGTITDYQGTAKSFNAGLFPGNNGFTVKACNDAGCSGLSGTATINYSVSGSGNGCTTCSQLNPTRAPPPSSGTGPTASLAIPAGGTAELERAASPRGTEPAQAGVLANAGQQSPAAQPAVTKIAAVARYAPPPDPRLSRYPPLRHDPRLLAHFEAAGGVPPVSARTVSCGDADNDCTQPAGGTALMVGYMYNSLGYLAEVQKLDSSGNPQQALWQATDETAQGQVDQAYFDAPASSVNGSGAALAVHEGYDAASGLLQSSTATAATAGDTLTTSYAWDGYNNLLNRGMAESVPAGQTAPPSLNESFSYDALNRLTTSNNTAASSSASYNAEGGFLANGAYSGFGYTNPAQTANLPGGGTYSYTQPHGLAGVTPAGRSVRSFSYDPNGNLLTESGDVTRSVQWTSYNKPASITSNGVTESFTYGPGRERLLTSVGTVTTTYIDGLFEAVTDSASGNTSYRHYLLAGGERVGVETLTANAGGQVTADTLSFYLRDQVGSVVGVVSENLGGSNQQLALTSYDAWGKARSTSGANAYLTSPPGTFPSGTPAGQTEGFGQHEDQPDLGLVDMEGRLYDPELGRFLSPDPNVQFPGSSQGYERYAYVHNNPLSLSDPSGYFAGNQVVGIAAAIVVTWACEGTCSGYTSAFLAGATQGYISSGGNLRDTGLSALEAMAFTYVGHGAGFSESPEGGELFARSVTEGVVGGLFTEAGGGRFGDGFLGAFAGSETSGLIGEIGGKPVDPGYFSPEHIAARVAVSYVVGGAVSRLTGGSFSDGALAAAMQRLYNDEHERPVNQLQIGNDAHTTLQQFARIYDPVGIFTEQFTDSNGTWFGGRPDIGDRRTLELWEIKSSAASQVALGEMQVWGYSVVSGFRYNANRYFPGGLPSFFNGQPTMTLTGTFAAYTYSFVGNGVISYSYQMKANFIYQPIPVVLPREFAAPQNIPIPEYVP